MLDVTFLDHRLGIGPRCTISFQRTLRIPDDGRSYPLPPGLGVFPVFKVADYWERVPPLWRQHGGAFIPMYQREALWLGFSAASWKPNAVKVAVGRVNALSGRPDNDRLHADPQDYMVCPEQPWLDGFNTGHGSIRQFVAMPLGAGYTVEASVMGTEEFGGIHITVFEPKPGQFPDAPPPQPKAGSTRFATPQLGRQSSQRMGLGAGGVMKQKIYPDPYGLQVWDQENYGSVVVHIVNSLDFRDITGIDPPPTPIDAHLYTQHGLPWFDLYDEAKEDIAPSVQLSTAKTIAARDAELTTNREEEQSIDIPEPQIHLLRTKDQERQEDSHG